MDLVAGFRRRVNTSNLNTEKRLKCKVNLLTNVRNVAMLVSKSDLNYHKIWSSFASIFPRIINSLRSFIIVNTQKRVSSDFQTPRSWLKKKTG